MKYSTTKISPAKKNISGKALVKSPRLRKSKQKAKEVYQMCIMQLRSGLTIKKTCSFRKETTRRPPTTAGNYRKTLQIFPVCGPYQDEGVEPSVRSFDSDIPLVEKCTRTTDDLHIQERSLSLSTYNDQSITFAFADGGYEIYVEDLGNNQEKGDSVDGHKLMVSLSPADDKNFLLHANNKEHSVELQKCDNPLPDQTFFFLHKEPSPSTCVSFECKSNPGVFIGVKDNHLALIKLKDQTKHSRSENIKFKLS